MFDSIEYDSDVGGYHAVIDGDGDQAAELDLVFRGRDREEYRLNYDRVEVEATRLGNTPDRSGPGTESHKASFDTTGQQFERRLRPNITQRTDGLRPTRIAVSGQFSDFTRMTIDPPNPEGDRADYRFELSKRVGYSRDQTREVHTLSFSRDPADIYPVFVPGDPRRAGTIWVLDATIGRFGDRFRFTFRKHGLSGGVRVGISPMSAGFPIGVNQMDIPIFGHLNVQIVRSLGPFLELDLTGNGRPDIRIYQGLEPIHPIGASRVFHEPEQHRSMALTITSGDGSRIYGTPVRRTVTEGRYTAESLDVEGEFESLSAAATLEGLEASARVPDLAADLAGTTRRLAELRARAVADELLSSEADSAYRQLVDRWLEAARASGPAGDQSRNDEAAESAVRFDSVWSTEAAGGTVRNHYPRASTRFVRNEFTGGGSSTTYGGYRIDRTRRRGDPRPSSRERTVVRSSTTPTHAQRLASALRTGDRSRASDLMSQIGRGIGRWLGHEFTRAAELADDTDAKREYKRLAAESTGLAALSNELEQLAAQNPTRASAVFHSAPEYIRSGAVPNLPLRLYYWKRGSTWYLKDLTHPTRRASLGVLESSGGTDSEPPEALFRKLNDKARYPKGYIQYQLPDLAEEHGRAGTIATTEPWRVSDVLNWIGLGLAAAALIAGWALSGGTATPVIVPALWGLSAGVTAAGGVAHMIEEADQGRLTGATIVLDLAQIVGSLAGAAVLSAKAVQAYRLGQVARAAGVTRAAVSATQAAQLIPMGQGTLRALLYIQVAADTTQLVLMGDQLIDTLAQIDSSDMSDTDKLRAKVMALGQFGFSAGLTYVSVRATVGELRAAIAAGGRVVHAGEDTLVTGLHTESRYAAELEAALPGSPALDGMASQRVRVVPVEQAGSSLGLARVEMVNGKPQMVVVDGAPLHVVREEAAHIEQLALLRRRSSDLSPAERRIQDAARRFVHASQRWSRLSPRQRVRAHQARLTLEEDAQKRLLSHYQSEVDAGRPVNTIEVDNAWQNLENVRQLQAELTAAERHVRAGGRLRDVDAGLDEAPALFAKKTTATTSVDPSWRHMGEDDFVRTYQNRYPNSTLDEAELRQRHRMNRRLSPLTGRLVDPSRSVPDVRASHVEGAGETMQMQGPGRAELSYSDQRKIDDLLEARDVARGERNAAASGNPPDTAARNQAQYRMNEASRQLGEHAASLWVGRRYPGPPRPALLYPTGGGSRSGDFDQVWRCTITEGGQQRTVYIVVEAKGGSSPLGSRRTREGPRAQQGTRLYFDDILHSMFDMGGEARRAVTDLRKARAADSASVRYMHVEAPMTYVSTPTGGQASRIGDVSIREFEVSQGAATPSTNSSGAQ